MMEPAFYAEWAASDDPQRRAHVAACRACMDDAACLVGSYACDRDCSNVIAVASPTMPPPMTAQSYIIAG